MSRTRHHQDVGSARRGGLCNGKPPRGCSVHVPSPERKKRQDRQPTASSRGFPRIGAKIVVWKNGGESIWGPFVTPETLCCRSSRVRGVSRHHDHQEVGSARRGRTVERHVHAAVGSVMKKREATRAYVHRMLMRVCYEITIRIQYSYKYIRVHHKRITAVYSSGTLNYASAGPV